MSTVFADISMSLDGYMAGPNDGPARGLGENGERLHDWIFALESWRERHGLDGGTGGADADLLDEAFSRTGAIVMGRRMFEAGEPHWGDAPPYRVPVFVLSRKARDRRVHGNGTSFTFVGNGIEDALGRARAAAAGGHVWAAGGASVIRQCLDAGLLDEVQLHLVPLLLGGGVRLFEGAAPCTEMTIARVVDSPSVTHLKYRIGGRRPRGGSGV